MTGYFKRRRRERLRAQPFPKEWRAIIERNVRLFARLPAADQSELLGHVLVFVDEKHFEGCGGLRLTDEMRVTVAAQACLLLLHRETDYYPRLTSILIYPTSYIVPEERHVGGGVWEEGEDVMLGHTQSRLNAVVLAWDETLHGARNVGDGSNLVFHEFAHQLDFEDSVTDGTPLLESPAQYASWARVLGTDFDRLRQAESEGANTLLDQYGATNPAEFFAVATEFFFDRPRELHAKHAALYEELRSFYRQDPAEWADESPPSGAGS